MVSFGFFQFLLDLIGITFYDYLRFGQDCQSVFKHFILVFWVVCLVSIANKHCYCRLFHTTHCKFANTMASIYQLKHLQI